ncbi:MAG: 3-phosphoshikimate 1-carboxyvinyltransferase [Oscillibacter sp.]|nr:3-phosphoshikimate 1-carboxyvinyltransferase [Oscillibacter sp.]
MDVKITPRRLSGVITPPPSKSLSHRWILAAALAAGTSVVKNVAFSEDIEATLRCMEALGASWETTERGLRIAGIGGERRPFGDLPQFDCGESGSTLRFLIPIALAVDQGGVFTGRGRLMERPQQPYFDLFDRRGISYALEDGVLTVRGSLSPGEYRLRGDVSSQFFTGLLMALPLLEGPSVVISTTKLESASYTSMTMGVLARCGIHVRWSPALNGFGIEPGIYSPFEETVEADWSQAAFWYAAISLGSNLRLRGLKGQSSQGDAAVVSHAKKLALAGEVKINLSDCPDLLPPLAVMAAVRRGTTHFTHAARLRLKESDRLATVARMLKALGGAVSEEEDGLTVYGVSTLPGGVVDGANDHRIVMAAAIAATRCQGPAVIRGAEAVKKSYPNFWRDYENLGGAVHVL